MEDLTIVIDNEKYNKRPIENLKIEIENEIKTSEIEDDVLLLGGEDFQNDDIEDKTVQNNHEKMIIDAEDDNETEFHVNLDKKPITLKTVPDKLYINESLLGIDDKEAINEMKCLNQDDLNDIYESLGINEECFKPSYDNPYRKQALHLYGVNEMSTNEIFDYLNKYRPYAIEWINDYSCNVVWNNDELSSFALFEFSKPFKHEEKSEIEEGEVDKDDDLLEDNGRLPPKLDKWRVGVEAKNGNLIYMRFAKMSDRKVKGAESKSLYYVKHGNPNYGNIKGLISNSKRNQLKSVFLNRSTNDDLENSSGTESNNVKKNKDIHKRLQNFNDKRRSNDEDEGELDYRRRRDDVNKRKMSMYSDDYESSNKRNRYDSETKRTRDDARHYIGRRTETQDLREKLKKRHH